MKSLRLWLMVVVPLLLAALLVLFLPARWAVPLVEPRLHGLHLEQVHGLFWNGVAETVRAPDGRRLGRVRWQLARSALWGGLDLGLQLDGPQGTASGRLQRDAQGRQVWSEVVARIDLGAWAPMLDSPLGTPQGQWDITLSRAVLQAGWPVELNGQGRWQGAAVRTRNGTIALGDLTMALTGSQGMLQGQLRDEGQGPLRADGRWQASPLGWRLDLRLQPRTTDPALHRWLGRLGQAQADGSIQLHRRGGLAAATPETAP